MASGEMSRSDFTFQFLRPILRHIVAFSSSAAVVFACMDWRHARDGVRDLRQQAIPSGWDDQRALLQLR